MLRLYYCAPPEETPSIPAELLSDYRRQKLSALKPPSARRESLFAELLLRYALADRGLAPDGPLEIGVGEYGKPYLRGEALHFNLSHTAGIVLCALSDAELGADVQVKAEARPPLLQRFFALDEREYVLNASDADEAFTELWTKKESWCKRSGLGLSLPLASFSVLDAALAPQIAHTRLGRCHIAVCTEAELPERLELIEVETGALLP